jgi:hypothetical protein
MCLAGCDFVESYVNVVASTKPILTLVPFFPNVVLATVHFPVCFYQVQPAETAG